MKTFILILFLIPSISFAGPSYSQIQAEMRKLATQYSDFVSYSVYGKSIEGRELGMLRMGSSKASRTKRPTVLITGVTHGDEYLGFEERLPRWILENKNIGGIKKWFEASGEILFVPILNPDGYEANTRENANGVDLNRDFDVIPLNKKKFTQPESRMLAQQVESQLRQDNAKLLMTMDYHCCAEVIVTPYSFTRKPMPQKDVKRHQLIEGPMKSVFGDHFQIGNTATVLGYLGEGTSKDYYYSQYNSISFTFEGITEGGENLEKHGQFWNEMLGLLLRKKEQTQEMEFEIPLI